MAIHDDKLTTISELAEIIARLRDQSKRTVHCHGVFDLLHIGHIRYLQQARGLGDTLVVTVTPDRFVNKGPHRPAFPDHLRIAALAALDCVDFVAVNEWPTATEAIEQLKPDIYAKGAEFRDQKTPEMEREEAAAASVGTQVEFIEDITSSSSHLINHHLGLFSEEVEHYLHQLKQEHSANDIVESLQAAESLKVLVVGEAIIDEYYECQTIGKSEKAPIVAAQYQSHERFVGGALAVANHLSAFCGQVDLVSMLGSENSEEDWLRTQLTDSIRPSFVVKSNSPTIVKRRYRESYYNAPLFEIDFLSDEPLTPDEDAALTALLTGKVGDYDAVIVADYGHGMLTESARRVICNKGKYVAVNAQANAANIGFHTITKYHHAHYAAMAHQELELEFRSRGGQLDEMVHAVADKLSADTIAVTLGKRGCMCYHRGLEQQQAPALATTVVDRFGAGEAFFAITSLCAVLGVPPKLLAFLGNVAGAEAVSIIGNSKFLEALPFQRHVQSLLK